MAEFAANVVRVGIEEHPNADVLEIGKVNEVTVIVPKGKYRTGDLAAYIPEAAVVPDDVLELLGLVGKLAGKKKNRVKAIKLRGVVSGGLLHPLGVGRLADVDLAEGDDVTELLGLAKYEPPIPVSMGGQVFSAQGGTVKYDIDSILRYPELLPRETPTVVTEKLHGTWCCMGWHPDFGDIVSSKGVSGRGLAFRLVEENAGNLYVRAFRVWEEWLMSVLGHHRETGTPYYLLGEIFGRGVQDLHYDLPNPGFRAFDVRVGPRYLPWPEVEAAATAHDGPGTVPVLGVVEDWPAAEKYVSGSTTFGGKHVREGVVMRPRDASWSVGDPEERPIAKWVSDAFRVRKGGTEFN